MGRGWEYEWVCEKWLPLNWRSFREKKVIFHEIDFETSELDIYVSKSSIWKHTSSCDNGVFSLIIISQLRRPMS